MIYKYYDGINSRFNAWHFKQEKEEINLEGVLSKFANNTTKNQRTITVDCQWNWLSVKIYFN